MKIKKQLTALIAASTLVGTLPASAHEGQHMTPEMMLSLARVGASSLSPDGKTIVYSVGFPNIKENKIRTELFSIASNGTGRRQLTQGIAGLHGARWIQQGRRISYISSESGEPQVWTMAPDGTDRKQVTRIEGGLSDYLFSPDETKLAYIKEISFGKSTKEVYPDLPKATGRIVTDLMYKHWDEWVETIPHIFIASVGNEPITSGTDILEGEPYEAPTKPFGGSEELSWSPDGKTLAYSSRKKTGLEYSLSTNTDIYLYDLASGMTRNITEGNGGYDTHPRFSPDGSKISWISMERDGYEADLKRLFIQELKTGKKTFLTDGFEYDVDETVWSPDSKSIFFLATKHAEAQLWELALKGRKIRQITTGMHDYTSLDLQAGSLLAGRQSYTLPTDLYLVDPKTGRADQLTHENKETLDRLSPISVEKRWVKTTDGGNMLVWVILPPNFDKTKKYPALLFCQGGPQSAVSQFFSYRWNMRLMAEQGYIVIAPNRHGVPSFGKAWNEQISGDYSGQNIQDYLTAVDEVKKEPWVDADRLGCVGASYGGYSVFYLAGVHQKRFKAFIAHAGIFNLEMQYMTTEEMWFANWDMGGAPWEKDNAVAQRTFANSPHKLVGNWDTPILVIHGERDYRILAGQGMAAFNAAKLRGIPAELLIYPDENHWILRPQNALLWQRTYFDWLDKYLKK
ncbi:S9 family peptidase [Porphyromonas sp. oral taxon 278]|uniref:S9 family peptidase n=1 Tax=Porphyromonas sp. oral taxon 278 TaxID=712437 RepID=UPI0025FF975A|nr:S9 family peptidase [Porphyromonas sp. oral taxon 278]